jgi:hypothetical protein
MRTKEGVPAAPLEHCLQDALSAQEKTNGLLDLVGRSIDTPIHPSPYVCLVASLQFADKPGLAVPYLFEARAVVVHPP